MTCRGIGTIQRLSLNIPEQWRFLSQRHWKSSRANQDAWKSTGHAEARFSSRLNRQSCGCVLMRSGTGTRKAGRQCLWNGDRVTSKAFERLLPIFGARNPLTVHLIMSSQFKRRCCGRQDWNNLKGIPSLTRHPPEIEAVSC